MVNLTPFTKHVAKAVRQAPTKELADTLAALVLKRLQSRQRRTQQTPEPTLQPWQQEIAAQLAGGSRATGRRRSARRIGRIKFYTPTDKVDVSRLGTFRHYMIATIRKHTNTRNAEQEHSACTDPKLAKNRLDFNWAADNGFINWN